MDALLRWKIFLYFILTFISHFSVHTQVISVEDSFGNFATFTLPYLVLNPAQTRIKCTDNIGVSPEWIDPNNVAISSANGSIFVTTNATEGSATLTFADNNIATEMEGYYACRVGSQFTFLPIFREMPFLNPISFTPSSPSVITPSSNITTISCATTGYPVPTIRLSEAQSLVSTVTSMTSPVSIDISGLPTSFYNFTCSAMNSYTQNSTNLLVTLVLTVEIVLTPVEFKRTPFGNQSISTADTNSPSYSIRVGAAFNLTCPLTELQFPNPVTWTYSLALGGSGNSIGNVYIPILTMQHAGNYTCGYESDSVTLQIIPTFYRLLIIRGSVQTPVVATRVYQVSTSETVTFLCIGSVSTNILSEGWFFTSGDRVTNSIGGLTVDTSQTSVTYELTFNNANTNLSGMYTCRVRNTNATLNQLTVNVNISTAPLVTTLVTTTQTSSTVSMTMDNTITTSNFNTVTDNRTNFSSTTASPTQVAGVTSTQLTLILAITFLFIFIVALCVITFVCCFIAYRVTYRKSSRPKNKTVEEVESSELSVYTHPVARNQYSGTYRKLSQDGNMGFVDQFKKLPTNPDKSSEIGQSDANGEMNRDSSIVPFDESRVVLAPDDSGSDYINASFVNGAFLPNRYIAAQAPLELFVDHFWRMIWEHDVKVIVMLTKFSERGVNLCHQYWPSSRPTQTYGIVIVDILEVIELRHCIIQTFKIKRMFEGKSRVVKHFQFLSWPENNIPDYPTSLITFTRRIRGYVKRNEIETPILVHCNLGIGRTGSWIAIDILWDKLEWDDTNIDVYGCCCLLNVQRKHMIQHITQYMFIHKTIKELTDTGNTEFEMEMFQHKFQEKVMSVHDNESLLGKEFKLLSIDYNDEQFRTAQLIENRPKNRYSNCIPIEDHRVILPKKSGDLYSDYINASYIDGNVRTSQFIITQTPSKANLEDFWRMVLLTRSEIMVIFPSPTKGSSSRRGSQYYPNVRSELVEGIYHISCLQDKTCEGYQYRIIGVHNKQDNTYLNLHHFQFLSLPSYVTDMVESYQAMHSMLHSVKEKSYEVSKGGPITLHCSSGCGWSAVFICLFVLLDRLEKETCIDVFQTVKALRLQRPHMVETLEQYEYIHRAVLEKFYPTLAHV